MTHRNYTTRPAGDQHCFIYWLQRLTIAFSSFMLLVACGISVGPPTTNPTNREVDLGAHIDQVMRNGAFAAMYGGLIFEQGHHVVFVTEQPQAVHHFLTEQGVSTSSFEVRQVDNALAPLEAAEVAAQQWLTQFADTGASAVDVAGNKVVIAVERQRLAELLGHNPENELVPYEQWPTSLKHALGSSVPGVDVELRAGVTVTDDIGVAPANP